MVILWRRGFFGKGALSRSDPSWRQRVQNKRAELDGKEKRKLKFLLAEWVGEAEAGLTVA